MMRLRGALTFLELLVLQLQWQTVVLSSHSYFHSTLTQENFHFSQKTYNGTISENAHGKTYILSPVRMGISRMNTSVDVEYEIDRGDKTKIFRAEPVCILDFCFLRIRTRTDASGELNREHKDKFDLRVKAEGKYPTGGQVLAAFTYVRVTVLDENDLSPLFYPEEYSVSIPENTTIHKGIVRVTASDADIGVNGEIYYSFMKSTKVFAIHPATGVVSLTRPLNYSVEKVHKLRVLANDRGLKTKGSQRSSTALVTISVEPVNYHSPSIIVHRLPTVAEHGNIGTVYAILTITDDDIGKNGNINRVAITSGNVGNSFAIVESTEAEGIYNIRVAANLDREQTPYGYNLTVIATDKGSPILTTTVLVHVAIQDTNDNGPEFDQKEFNVSVSEVVPVNTPVATVKAGDQDLGRNGEVEYSIVSGNEEKLFKIDMESGLITTRSFLDAEKLLMVRLQIQAEDKANSGARKIGKTFVNIDITDFNDNAPVFDETKLSGSVKENAANGTTILQVSATDADANGNGRVSYSIVNFLLVPFEIDHFTGTITTTRPLDYEVMQKMYHVVVRASDWGTPHRQETEAVVAIKLENVNDNEPGFEKVDCSGYLSREAKESTEIVILPAIDFDEGDIINYRIVDGNENNCFNIEPSTGGISLGNCDLAGIGSDTIRLLVDATDGAHSSVPAVINLSLVNSKAGVQEKAIVNCKDTNVTDRLQNMIRASNENNKGSSKIEFNHDLSNRYAPEFSSSVPKYFEVSEGTPPGTSVLNMTATDRDSNSWYNSKILYVISAGNSDGAFQVDTFTGSLIVMSKLDREHQSEYSLQVNAQDMGKPSHTAQQLLRIVISDENDNSPMFEHDEYGKSVYEYVAVNSTVLQVYATDNDKDLNARIKYSLLTDTEDFYIEPSNGMIKVRRQLDRERLAVYQLSVMAKDSGLHTTLSTTTQVTITLQDVNDNEPKFVPSSYSVKVREDLPVGTVVMILTANDPDVGENGLVTYELVDGMDNKFEIDELSGTIRLLKKLDYETKQVYNITAKAVDCGTPTLVSTCFMNVEVVDVDENLSAPRFDTFVAQDYVYENKPIGTFVAHVSAMDDIGPFEKRGQMVYSIRDGSGLGRFSIDTNGTIRTSQVLDRETISHYWLTVYAQDGGLVPKFARQEVLIKIVDENDNVPLSRQPLYHVSVPENSREGVEIMQVEAYDGDLSDTQKITFQITGGDPQHFFKIHSTQGMISTTGRALNREDVPEHAVEVTISDNDARSPLSSKTRVVIKVLDENDNRPQFADKAPNIKVLECLREDSDIDVYRVVAKDHDEGQNAYLTYTIKSQRGNGQTQFRVDSVTGVVYSTKDLVQGRKYELQVRVSDSGTPRRKAIIKLNIEVVSRPKMSTNPPTFLKANYAVSVAENDLVGELLEMLSGEDEDGDSIWYSIRDGNQDNKFAVQPQHGTLFVAGGLDWETQPSYNLTVCATDGVYNSCVPVHISIINNNEYEPEFSEAFYTAEISENVEVNTNVLQVFATDKDKDKRLFYTMSSAGSTVSMQKFKIHPESGVIQVAESLDREALSHHTLTIMVGDEGTPSKKSFARVNIAVLDHNDHAPQFLSKSFDGRVFETAAIGTSVLQVIAVDNDKGENAEICFSIISGNVGGSFTMDEKLGIVITSKELDRMKQSNYELIVMAKDKGAPSLSSTARISIAITLSNNSPPRFKLVEYAVELKENLAAGHIVVVIQAESQSSLVYEITSGNHFGMLMINPNSGVISTKTVVDYEEHHIFNLTVTATNIVGATSSTTVIIHVTDENDNKPDFLQKVYYGNVSEMANLNSMVFTREGSPLVVQAQDKDSGANSRLKYQITDARIRAFFDIDSSTGALKTRSSLDHETNSMYNFTVQVSDLGQPSLVADIAAQVIVCVSDVNDSPPRFTNHTFTTTVLLPTYKDVVVIQVTAFDPDTTVNAPLSYSILDGNQGHHFNVNSETGELFVEDETNMDKKYSITVQVSDGKYDTTASVIITVQNTVDTGLHFSRNVYTATIEEQQEASEVLLAVMAIGHRLNEPLEFTLLNNRAMFSIMMTSGVIETQGYPFDRELVGNYTLVVEVKDIRGRLAHCLVIITVTDINDNAPVFVGMPYNSVVSFDASDDRVVKRVQAFDLDDGSNGQVRYSITDGGQGKFSINHITGDITVKRLSPTDENRIFELKIEAQDMGRKPQRSDAIVPIHVVNRNSPVFDKQIYNVSVFEKIAMHTPVTNIQALSPQNHKIIYSISEGDKYGDFAVNFDTAMDVVGPCLISVVGTLDYEETKTYDLTLRATDTQTGSYSEAIVFVNLKDINDNAPTFESQGYTEAVREGVAIGTEILTVKAIDKDVGLNSLVHYSIAPITMAHEDVLYFHIDSETGVIITKKKLDYERRTDFYFLAVAIDCGIPALNSTVVVHIILMDLNDNAPHFSRTYYECRITDQAKRGQLVTKVVAYDDDQSNTGTLFYSIVNGNEKKTFAIDSSCGLITVSEQREPDFQSAYMLNVSVTDGVYTSYARVTVTVRNTNKHVPVFSSAEYFTEYSEINGKGMPVLTVSATDEDRGTFGLMTYTVPSDRMKDIFHIDADSGEMFTKLELDREKQSLYVVPVAATDNGGRMGFASVHITVGDFNDCIPHFLVTNYQGNVFSNATIGQHVLQVKATDEDAGVNGKLVYSLYPNKEAFNPFNLDSTTGLISVNGDLSQSANKVFQFFVGVGNEKELSMQDRAAVDILVMGPGDNPPVFEQKEYAFFVQEDVAVGSIIATIKATANQPVTYSIVPESIKNNHLQKFHISSKGQITISEELDHEETSYYLLTVKVETQTSPPLAAYTEVSIQLHDVNDNVPIFDSNPYLASVIENAPVEVRIIQLQAYDKDQPTMFTYTFGEGMEEMANIFAIEAHTGWLTLITTLDREIKDEYNLSVVVYDDTDRHSHHRHSSSTSVLITVTDYNDNAPVFIEKHLNTAVNEGAVQGTVLRNISAIDRDSGENAEISYYITGGDPLGQFQVHSSGELFVNKPLDWETKSHYELTVAATDGGFVTYVTIHVDILDDNDHAPKCEKSVYTKFVAENVPINSVIDYIQASDEDEANTPYSKISYAVSGPGADVFIIEKNSGVLRTRKTLDRETTCFYHLLVAAVDGGGNSCTSDILITVTDINDNKPEFSLKTTTFHIPENAQANTLLTRVTATDKDSGISRRVKFKLQSLKDDLFVIDPVSGIISVKNPLDREQQPEYNITVIAYNPGFPDFSTSIDLHVLVGDENDNPPKFHLTKYTAAIREDADLQTEVIQVLATSQDIGKNAEIKYTLTGGNEQGKFAIDSDRGMILVAEPLDHELSKEYFLTITATDKGETPLSCSTIVNINITDVNDNAPQFGQSSYSTSVKEDARKGTEVIRVQATDVDSLSNSQIHYSLVSGDMEGKFTIGKDTGVIRIKETLDREMIDHYALIIEAEDSGDPKSRSATTVVSVYVLDTNDNPPRFTQANYTARVQRSDLMKEGRRTGDSILMFMVTDIDLVENGPPFDFDIISGNSNREFHMSNDGELSLAGKLNKELRDTYELTVRVYDSGRPSQYADTTATIYVVDESMHAPVVRNLSITISSYKDKFPGGVIGKVDYKDDDPYDTVIFQVVSNNRYLFDVDRHNGNVIALLGLDAGHYEINISVSDGKFTSFSQVSVDVVSISEEMVDNAITIQFANMIPEQFFANSKKDFQDTLKRELDVSARNIKIINVQPATGPRFPGRWKRDTSSNLDVLFAVRKSGDRFFKKNSLRKKVLRAAQRIESAVGVQVIKVFSDTCADVTCTEGTCVGSVVFDNSRLTPVIVGGESFVSARHYYSYQCICQGDHCDSHVCGGVPCPSYKLCERDRFNKYVCVCPNGKTGDRCDKDPIQCKPSDVSCLKGDRPMTFMGRSYARWELNLKTAKQLTLSLWIRTRQLNANLMNTRGIADYSVLEITDGKLQYKFDCGSGEGLVTIPVAVNDGTWHKINVERNGRIAEMELDMEYKAMSTAPGTNEILNLNTDQIYFGAEVNWHEQYQAISHGFEGCMKDIRIFDMPLLFSGSNKVTKDQLFERIDFNCKEDPWKNPPPNICSSHPCMHDGTCVYSGLNSFTCQCKARYLGSKCEVDTNPCQDSPCLHQGQCLKDTEIPNGFSCKCQGKFRGKKCEYGQHCIPSPCLHGGTCIEGPHSHICQCQAGYEGVQCEVTADMCYNNPCQHGSTCHVYAGGTYYCNCTMDRKGRHCEELILPVITGGIKAEEIYGIAGVGAGLIFIVLIFVMCRMWRRKKRERRRNNITPGIASGDDEIQYHGMKEHEMKRKLSNPDMAAVHTYTPQPPPVPTRPASYTPSTHDSLNTLNNFDTVRNYGSAADELETTGIHNIPTFQEYLQTFQSSHRSSPVIPSTLPPPPRSNAPSDSDSIQKQPWEFEYPNILENYSEVDKKQVTKSMPGMMVPVAQCGLQRQDASSYSSLPVSESEEDLNGYHWDTSDWAPRPSLPNISEVPSKEVPDSPSSSNNSNDSNIHISNIEPDPGTVTDEPEYVEDSEYVGDSEYAENEFEIDDQDDLPPCYADHPNYQQILELRDMDDTYELPQSLQVSHHPNHYLPNYSFSGQMEQDGWPDPPTDDDNSNVSDDNDNDNDSVIHYAYQNVGPQRSNLAPGYTTRSEYNTDHNRSAASIMDDMSVSAGGYTSTNGSCSDISAYLCEIEDSEINQSEDSGDEDQSSQRLLAAHLHTQV
ncbi:protocadherin Fat 1-like isoform X3 [Haliotis rufescens]|uniref:protocadherin Fat 1-like isoform X3 n=1 Tax=Haliotis rufescens TaxID=6454 RepID=UPI00201EF89C|nr:protocadherin Fat 1-like isoform X3 [Haliotis rufescens]